MRPLVLFLLSMASAACTRQPADPLDAPITLAHGDTALANWRSFGLVGIERPSAKTFVCGTFFRTPTEVDTWDSVATLIRFEGGVICR